jgi:hypothetical protein
MFSIAWLVPLLWTLITVKIITSINSRDYIAWAVVLIFDTLAWVSTYKGLTEGWLR